MDSSTVRQTGLREKIQTRSMGVKLIVVCTMALAMTIPALLVGNLVDDRTQRAAEVVNEISGHVGGRQVFLGPTLTIPYNIPAQYPGDLSRRGVYLIFPARGEAALNTNTEDRRRSLFKVPVFRADLKFDATFDLAGAPASLPAGAELDWQRAEIVIGVSDVRGALADATVSAGGKAWTLLPAGTTSELTIGGEKDTPRKLALLGARLDGLAKPNAQFSVTSTLRFSGAQRIAVLAYGKTTHVSVKGDWASPGFDGGFLPITRAVSRDGFSAQWSVPFIARGVPAEGLAGSMAELDATQLGVSFIEVADPYQSVNRAVKYALLFLGLLFLSYFVFEVTTGKRVHPAQYILVGMAQIIFYLLLLSLAERIGFDWGFGVAGTATVVLLSVNAGWVFVSRLQGIRALVIFSLLYVMIYQLLRLEDNALLVGAIASFLTVTAAMYFTRGMDWYGSGLVTGATGSARPMADGNVS